MELIRPLFLMIWSFVIEFHAWNLGEQVCTHFEAIHDTLLESEWYSLPIEIQKLLPVLMMTTQQPVSVSGFANTILAWETFRKVILKVNQS